MPASDASFMQYLAFRAPCVCDELSVCAPLFILSVVCPPVSGSHAELCWLNSDWHVVAANFLFCHFVLSLFSAKKPKADTVDSDEDSDESD